MSMNLILRNDNAVRDTHLNWGAICAVSEQGYVFMDNATVTAVGKLLEKVRLANGETIIAYVYEADEPYETLICAFGPSLLPTDKLEALRGLLASYPQALNLLDTVIRLGLQISLSGKDLCEAHIKAVNWPADEVKFNRCSGNLYAMLKELGIAYDPTDEYGEVSFEEFVKAVNDNGWKTDSMEELDALVACGRRQEATHVYWA